MRSTPYHHYALYEPVAAPDLTATGEYNSAVMAIDADMHAEETERKAVDSELDAKLAAETKARTDADAELDTAYKAADTALGKRIDAETAAREAADTALGSRIDNAETEISANSADLTGIKGLTYGSEHVQFLENENGSYTSPALEEIAEQIAQGMTCIQMPSTGDTISVDSLSKLQSDWPNVALIETTNTSSSVGYNILFPIIAYDSIFAFSPISGAYSDEGAPYNHYVEISTTGNINRSDMDNDPYWSNIQLKPFSIIGSGLKVESGALTVDTSAIPSSGLTQLNATIISIPAGTEWHTVTGYMLPDDYEKAWQLREKGYINDASTGLLCYAGADRDGTLHYASAPNSGFNFEYKVSRTTTTHGEQVRHDMQARAIAPGITGDTTWGEIEQS